MPDQATGGIPFVVLGLVNRLFDGRTLRKTRRPRRRHHVRGEHDRGPWTTEAAVMSSTPGTT